MQKVILLRFGEIFLKGRNKRFFENTLMSNIKKSLGGMSYDFLKSQNRYYIENLAQENVDFAVEKLKKVFGLHSISVAFKMATDLEEIKNVAFSIAPKNTSFRVTCNRADKTVKKTSPQIASEIGGFIFTNGENLTVDLYNAKFDIKIDIRENGFTYVFSEIIKCAQGMPVGTAGSGLLLLSGGIDSPVAGFKMAKRGMQIQAVHFCSPPYTSEQAKEKVVQLAQQIANYTGNFNLMIVPFTEIQLAIHKNCKAEYMITIMRRIMVRIAERLANKYFCGALITGESLGQVASQTMQSMTVVQEAVELLPIFRPLIAMDKEEIIDIAKDINTFETSILPYEDCCTVFLPKNPIIKPKLDTVIEEENRLDVENLIASVMEKIENIKIFANS